uniref:Uncharacterized protein n=1 Tax=Mycena chlorophos TaxID=658473 RepID=A0ABQ0LNB4_MYCCL|nr:predicted protein [Mycena chlorophos]
MHSTRRPSPPLINRQLLAPSIHSPCPLPFTIHCSSSSPSANTSTNQPSQATTHDACCVCTLRGSYAQIQGRRLDHGRYYTSTEGSGGHRIARDRIGGGICCDYTTATGSTGGLAIGNDDQGTMRPSLSLFAASNV